MPDPSPNSDPRSPSAPVGVAPVATVKVGDVIRKDALTLTVTHVGDLITWRVDRGGIAPLMFNATPAEFSRLLQRSLATGATFHPAIGAADRGEQAQRVESTPSSSDLPPTSAPSV